MADVEFDVETFACVLDGIRFKRRLTWRDVSRQAGISPATGCRIANRKRPDVDSLAKLLTWGGLKFEKFITTTPHPHYLAGGE